MHEISEIISTAEVPSATFQDNELDFFHGVGFLDKRNELEIHIKRESIFNSWSIENYMSLIAFYKL